MPVRLRMLAAAILVAIGLLAVQQAGAAPTCTTTWKTAMGDGSWGDGSKWDHGVPVDGSVVCIEGSVTVTYSTGTVAIADLFADGNVTITGGTLQITDTANDSRIGTFAQTSGTLGGAATVALTNGGTWSGGTWADGGVTTIPAGKTLSLNQFTVNLTGARLLDNFGTLLFATASSGLSGFNTARIVNESSGVIRKTVGSSTATATTSAISAPVENDGKVESVAALGNLSLGAGSGGTSTGTYGSAGAAGLVQFTGSAVHTLGDGAKLLDGAVIVGNVDVIAASGAPAIASGAGMTSGTMGGDGVLSITGPFRWAGGTMAGTGTTVVQASQTVTLDQFTVNLSASRVLDNFGTMLFATASSGLSGFNTARIVNESSGVIRKTVGSSTATATTSGISAPLENDGKVESTAALGVLSLGTGSGGTSTGTYGSSGAAGVVQLAGSAAHTLGDGAKLLDGTLITGNAVAVVAAAATPVTASGASMTNGTVTGDGVLSITGPFRWAGGTMAGTGTTIVQAGQTVTMDQFTVNLSESRVLDNLGTILLATQSAGISGFNTARIVNESSGVIRKTVGSSTATATTSAISAPLENDGKVESVAALGNLSLGSGTGATSTGTYGSAGAAGLVQFTGSAVHTLGDGAKLLDGTVLSGNNITIPAGATVSANGARETTGTLGGAGTLALTGGTFTYSGGTMNGSGITSVGSGATLAVTGPISIGDTREVDVGGLMTITGDTFVGFSANALIHVLAGGTLRKTGGTNATGSLVTVPVRNDGTIESQSGRLELFKGSGVDTGTFAGKDASNHLVLSGTGHVLAGTAKLLDFTEIAGEVTVKKGDTLAVANEIYEINGGLLTGDVSLTGTMHWSGGSQSGPGTTTVAAGGQVLIDNSCSDATLTNGRRLVNQGTMQLTKHSIVALSGTSLPTIENAGSIDIDDSVAGDCTDSGFSGNGVLHNTGTITKHGGTGIAELLTTFDNDGALQVTSGTVKMKSADTVTQSGSFTSAAGATYAFDDGSFVLDTSASLTGSPSITGAELRIPDGVTVTVPAGATMLLDGGGITGAGTVEILGTLNWLSGGQVGPGTTTIEPGGTATIVSADPVNPVFAALTGRALVNEGTVTVDNGVLSAFGGASILNRGLLTVTGVSDLEGSGSAGGFSGLLHNVGTLRKTGVGDVPATVAIDNDGTIEVLGGSLSADALLDYTSDGGAGLRGAIVDGTYVVRGGSALGVPGKVQVIAGHVVLDGAGSTLTTHGFSGPPQDALGDLRRIASNGELELAGNKAISTTAASGVFTNAGSLRLGNGTTFSATAGYAQTAAAVLRAAASGTAGLLAVTGGAALAGRLDVLSTPATVAKVVGYGSHTGTFGTVTGSGFTVTYDADGVNVHAPGHLTDVPPPDAAAPAPASPAAALPVDDPWTRHGDYLVATRRGATLISRGVRGRGLDIVAATGPRQGAIRITWAGRTRTVSLRSAKARRRTIRVLRFGRTRKGTVVVRTLSARRVAIASLVVRR